MTEPKRVAFVSLGCAKNLVDSEKMLGQLVEAGCALVNEDQADAVVINTCGFLGAARAEADQVIGEILQRKERSPGLRVVVVGCLVQRDGDALLARHPGVDALVGVHRRDDVVRAVLGEPTGHGGHPTRREPDLYLGDYHAYTQIDTARVRLTPRHYAYLRLGEGCKQKCTFCTIPAIRGPLHSKPPEAVLAEARELIADGTVELNLIGQDTTSYGRDIGHAPGLAGLLRLLDGLDGVQWIRLLYAYPSMFTDYIVEALGECRHVCKYVDLPLQHINDRILKAMHRQVDRVGTERLLHTLRERIPEVTIRTTLIAGFPGETEAEFEELVEFVQGFGFDALGVFPFSSEPDTPAGRMKKQLPPDLIQERVEALMLAQQETVFARARGRIGAEFAVLVDERVDEKRVVGRHAGQAPEVDSVTYVESSSATPGTLLTVRCHACDGYDLVTRPTEVTLPVWSP